MLKVKKISGGYDKRRIINDMSFHVKKGEIFGIIGPNGSGKTTLLKMLSKTLPYTEGTIVINDEDLLNYSPRELAKLVAVLPQQTMHTYSYTVKETVALGRYAHQHGLFKSETKEDERIIAKVMEQTGVKQYEHISLDQLSGGERQRVFLAQALAQQPKILLLDEPTNHLDLSYQKELLDVLKTWARQRGLTVVAIFHDLNLAGLYCDQLMLLKDGKIIKKGTPELVLKKQKIESVYKADIEQHPHPKVPRPQMLLNPEEDLDKEFFTINETKLQVTNEYIKIKTKYPLKTMSSGVTGSGVGWYRNFINRRVDVDYDCSNYRQEMEQFLLKHNFPPEDTVSMMTAVDLKQGSYQFLEGENFSVFVVATASAGNAVDASFGSVEDFTIGTVNLWIFVNGYLSEQAFIQGITTATEAKTKAFLDLQVKDRRIARFATGTPTDSILIAGIQTGEFLEFAGTATPLGRLIGRGVYKTVKSSLKKYFDQLM